MPGVSFALLARSFGENQIFTPITNVSSDRSGRH